MGKQRRRFQIPIRVVLIAGSLLICGLPIIGIWTWSYREVLRHEVSEVDAPRLACRFSDRCLILPYTGRDHSADG